MRKPTCSVEGCDRRAMARGWCSMHYGRWHTRGTTDPKFLATRSERFWSKVDKNGPVPAHRPDLGQCWIWTAQLDTNGYGRFGGGAEAGAHRVAYQLVVGPIPAGLWALHRCDNPPCVRPSHLFLGTVQDNNIDKILKGRGTTKLTSADVLAIRSSFSGQRGERAELAALYGVTRQTIDRVVRGSTWAWLPPTESALLR